MTIPDSHLEEAQKLEADGIARLWKIELKTGSVSYFRYGESVTWQDDEYEFLAYSFTGEGKFSNDEVARPKMTVVNPAKIFGPFAEQGYFDLAKVTRYEVLHSDLDSDVNVFRPRKWVIGKVESVTEQSITFEFRDLTDIPNFQFPPRSFTPPEFPSVSI